MAATEIVYCLEKLTDYTQFERLCTDLMSENGFSGIEPLGGFHDWGRDAIHWSQSANRTTIFAYSVREDWLKKLLEDAERVRVAQHVCDALVFLTTSDITAAKRDSARMTISETYGWELNIYPIERLRAMLSSNSHHLISKHPQIFTPSFFQRPLEENLIVRASPTRRGRFQLAQFHLYNSGLEPILIRAWHATWRIGDQPRAISSIDCEGNSFPIRLEGRSEVRFLVGINQYQVEALSNLGVEDADGKHWNVEQEALEGLVRTAVLSKPPPQVPRHPSDADLASCKVELSAELQNRQTGVPVLYIVFQNHGPLDIPINGAQISWAFDPPPTLSKTSGLQVHETGGSISVGVGSSRPVVKSGDTIRFLVDPGIATVLTQVLSPSVPSNGIALEISAGEKLTWREDGLNEVAAVKSLATKIVESWD